jgi:hypothetical protein
VKMGGGCTGRPVVVAAVGMVLLLSVVACLLCFGLVDANPNLAAAAASPQALKRIESEFGAAFMLPLSEFSPVHQLSRHGRELVADARMNLHDDLLTKGYYTSRVFIGTPPQEFALIVDTGSTVTYVPCSSCTHCGPHQAWTNPTTLSFLLFVPFFCCCDHEGMAYMFRCMTSLFVTFITRLWQAYCSLMFLQMLVCCL